MLELQDGQSKVHCKHHDLPLVVASKQRAHFQQCSLQVKDGRNNQQCHRQSYYACPKDIANSIYVAFI